MSFDRTRAAALAGLVVLLGASGARADGPDAAASELFRQGRALIKEGRWEDGCPKLEASMKRYAAASTQLNLALCAEQRGEVATAWAMARRAKVLNRETAGETRRQKLDEVADEIVSRLEPRLPRLRVVVLPAGIEAKVAGEGGDLPVGVAVPLDPGEQPLTVTAPGRKAVERTVSLQEGQTIVIEITLPPAEEAPAPRPKPKPAPAPVEVEPAAWSPPLWAWLTGGAGLMLSGLSIGFAVDAVNIAGDLEARCGADLICDEDLSFDPGPDNRRKNVSTGLAVGFGAGAGVALTAAVVGLVVGGEPEPAVVGWATPGSAGVGYRVSF